MRSWALCIALATVTATASLPASAAGQTPGSCQVGGAPSFAEDYQHGPPKPLSEVLVIGCGETVQGPIEIVAFDSRFGLCVFVDHVAASSGFGTCPVEPTTRAIAIDDYAVERRETGRFVAVTGPVAPDVATTSATFHRKGRVRTSAGVVAQLTPDLMTRLNVHIPFGYFVAEAQGCARFDKIEVSAFGADGTPLEEASGPFSFPLPHAVENLFQKLFDFCNPKFPGGLGTLLEADRRQFTIKH